MPQLTLRTLLAYIDDTLEPAEARSLGKKVAESDLARELVERIKKVTRRRGLAAPESVDGDDETADPNTVAEYLDNALDSATLKHVEQTCMDSDVHLAEVAACHQILTLVLTEPVRVPPRAHRRMYELVQPPASEPNRRPSKTLPIGGAAPPTEGPAEVDDADAALLLGMKRYSATTTWAARFALFGAVAVLLVLLAGAVMLSLPQQPPAAPGVAPGNSYALQSPRIIYLEQRPKVDEPAPIVGEKPKAIVPAVVVEAPPPRPVDPGGVAVVPPPPVKPVGPDPWQVVLPPSVRHVPVGVIDKSAARALVVSYRPDNLDRPEDGGAWGRVRADDTDKIFTTEPTMALPGYKATVVLGELNKQVEVYLWGNVPEQVPYRVFESRVLFHAPSEGFDADLTLVGGRIYLKAKKFDAAKKAAAARVRVRLGAEVWDVTLPDENSDVLVELISWFEPGIAYAPKGGEKPRLDARVAVVAGGAGFHAPNRTVKIDLLAVNTEVAWDSKSDKLSPPRPIASLFETEREPKPKELKPKEPKPKDVVADLLAETADAVKDPNVVLVKLKERLVPEPTVPFRDQLGRLAIYSWVALADSSDAGSESLKDVLDILNSELNWLGRQAVITSLVHWVARDVSNTARLHALLSKPQSGVPVAQVDPILQMLRGFVNPTRPDADRLNTLVDRLAGFRTNDFDAPQPAIALRDIALWNLVVADTQAWIPPIAPVNVGAVGTKFDTPAYQAFIGGWKKRIDDIKKRPPPK